MSLWVDKYRPQSLEKMDYHKDLSVRLRKMAASGDFPHILVYGPSGAGKKTRIMAVLKELYGSGVEKLKIDQRTTTTSSGRKVEINIVQSNYHLEVTPSDVGNYDRVVIQDLIKETAQTQQVDTNAPRRFKVVVINEAESLSRDAQQALRRTMEKYMGNIRFIMCCKSTSKIMAPIRSRCLLVRVAAPEVDEMVPVLTRVAEKERHSVQPEYIRRIAERSGRNMRKALLMLETACVQGLVKQGNPKEVPITDWEEFAKATAKLVIEEQSAMRLLQVRARLYELLTKCIPADTVLKTVATEILGMVDGHLKPEIMIQAAFYEHRLRAGSKAIFHLEAFVAKVMAIYKRYLVETYG
ncbi:P-loop containing nucleoside triphosphate hydrolase protein [Hyaloraphidium curvatum]|nr:P-loop containing nucleoside triphosphate hydrolase protein [Hyaloraphidium curvatum]